MDPRDDTGERRRDLGRRLVGDHLDERRVLFDHLALFHEPAIDLGLGDPFAEVGKLEVGHQKSRTFRAPCYDAVDRRQVVVLVRELRERHVVTR